jgi:hypothetical protein
LSHKHIVDMGRSARLKAEKEYNSDLHYERLMRIYHRVLST